MNEPIRQVVKERRRVGAQASGRLRMSEAPRECEVVP